MNPEMKNYLYGSQLFKSILNGYKVISYKTEDKWVAQCLDYDMKGQAETGGQAMVELLGVIEMARKENALESIPKADPFYFDLWDSEEVIAA